jgi:hypothetical protein
LIVALRRSDRTKGGQPPFDPVMMCKILALHALYSLSDEGTEFQIKDRLSFQRFLGIGPQGKVPSATTGWPFRERLAQAKAIDKLPPPSDSKQPVFRGLHLALPPGFVSLCHFLSVTRSGVTQYPPRSPVPRRCQLEKWRSCRKGKAEDRPARPVNHLAMVSR